MDYHIEVSKFNKLFWPFTALCLFLFFSCAQNPVDIAQSELCLVFEYADEESLPSARLSAFVESESDVRRREELEITSGNEGYVWASEDLIRIKKGDKNWAGYTNFIMQKNEPFPSGSYRIVIRNADQKEVDEIIDFEYDSEFYELTAEEAAKKMQENKGIKKVAVYDENNLLLFYDIQSDKYDSARKIWNTYSNASYFNVIWQTADGFVVCILPKQLVKPESDVMIEKKEQ